MYREAPTRRPALRAAGACAAVLAVLACAALACSNYVRRSTAIRGAVATGQYEAALDQISEIDPSNSLLLLLYEQGMVQHCQGDYAASNLSFERSEAVLDALYTRSITRGLASMAISETVEQYRGDPFEALFVNYYKILNYLALGDVEDAMVECRRINRRLQMFQDGGETYFVNEPFLQYLTGLVYTRGGERTDAEVSYRLATRLYDDPQFAAMTPTPPTVFCDAAALARAVGDREAVAEYAQRAECPDDGLARVNVLLDCGEIVAKGEESIVLPILENDTWNDDDEFAWELRNRYGQPYDRRRVKYWLKVALPTLLPVPPRYTRVVVRARSADGRTGESAETVAMMVENLDEHARRAYEEKQGTLFVRAIVRALIKYAAFNAADKKDDGLGAVVNLFNVVTETADTRSWSTLPQAIWMARLDLPPGEYRIEADLYSADGVKGASATFSGVQVRHGAMVFRSARIF
ncbi:MAG: hypothetical protein OEX18_02990 [Candidatus Krumholzibacteria bacterium]|nr:hypothetical protein [Candidatus Krumholzibacteria bacterium]MDH4336224.1 hypothetical protein [Candidatus Krumholzibacteria bacterium]MDH5268865.1 hypothetical protein [Candidatus Krumholzibacteria bacterium]